jgi:hypothetical protein
LVGKIRSFFTAKTLCIQGMPNAKFSSFLCVLGVLAVRFRTILVTNTQEGHYHPLGGQKMSRKKYRRCFAVIYLVLGTSLLAACSMDRVEPGETEVSEEVTQMVDAVVADVVSVEVRGEPNVYQFSVGIASPDTGCEQYADWWEVLTGDGELLYRRILAHSHVDEQPFVRSGGPVAVAPDTVVWVRAHMHPGGYSGVVMKGTVQAGFEVVDLGADFAAQVESEPPQPTGCAF